VGVCAQGVLVLPSKLSRHNCLAAPHALTAQLADAVGSKVRREARVFRCLSARGLARRRCRYQRAW